MLQDLLGFRSASRSADKWLSLTYKRHSLAPATTIPVVLGIGILVP